MKKLNTRGFSHEILLVLIVVGLAIVGSTYVVISHAATSTKPGGGSGGFTLRGTYAPATVQPTARGKIITSLAAWNNKIYLGYGDYNTNTGPLTFMPFDPSTNSFAATAENAPCDASAYPATGAGCDQTEEVDQFRIINGNLYAASIDPQGGTTTDYAVATTSGGWQQYGTGWGNTPVNAHNDGVGMNHIFDMNTVTGSDLWMVGQKDNIAMAYCSADGGATWKQMLAVPVPQQYLDAAIQAGNSGDDARFYFAGVLNGKLYLQAPYFYGGAETSSHVYSGDNCSLTSTSWSTGPNLFSRSAYYGKPDQFAGKMIMLSIQGGSLGLGYSGLLAFDGTTTTNLSSPVGFYDYTIDGSTLYAVGSNGTIYSTTDLVNWSAVSTAPTTARSIAVSNGTIYVGTTDSKLYSAPLSTNNAASGTKKHLH